jgi:hypothetical protein
MTEELKRIKAQSENLINEIYKNLGLEKPISIIIPEEHIITGELNGRI